MKDKTLIYAVIAQIVHESNQMIQKIIFQLNNSLIVNRKIDIFKLFSKLQSLRLLSHNKRRIYLSF
jgi:hypothetical protein